MTEQSSTDDVLADVMIHVDGASYVAFGVSYEELTRQVDQALAGGAFPPLEVFTPPEPGVVQRSGTLYLRGDRISSIAVTLPIENLAHPKA
ncbi:hypothetical protein [Angustibacter luteus]|uniref:Uncharacterized protein n=1 Tax=Angustibacter luteus TaxID=658456 RepID=A0ABW1JGG6_9ACTN